MKNNMIFCFFISVFFSSCNLQSEKIDNSQVRKIVDTSTVKQLVLPLDKPEKFPTSYQIYQDKDDKVYYVSMSQNKTISVYNLESNPIKKEKNISIDTEKDIYPFSFYLKSLDSVFIFASKMTKMAILNGRGEVIYNKTIKNPDLHGYAMPRNTPILLKDNILSISVNPYKDPIEDITFFSKENSLEILWDLSKGMTKEKLNIGYPTIFNGKKWGVYHSFFFRINPSPQKSIYSFSIDPHVHLYENGAHQAYLMKSNYINNIPEFTKKDDYSKYYMLNGNYGEIIYDKYRKLYYRLAYQGISEQDYTMVNFYQKSVSILVADENFNSFGEILLPKNTYLTSTIFVNKDGLCVPRYHPNNKQIKEDFVVFDVLKLSLK